MFSDNIEGSMNKALEKTLSGRLLLSDEDVNNLLGKDTVKTKTVTKIKVVVGTKDKFEILLAEYLDTGYEIPTGERMNIKDNIYKILVIKRKKIYL